MLDELNQNIKITPNDCNAVVLAAGLSSRMGEQNKLMLPVYGKPLLWHTLNALTKAAIGQIILVLGHERELIESNPDIQNLISTDTEKNTPNFSLVTNPDYESGQASSVMCGVNALAKTTGPTFICLGDQPLIKSEHLLKLLDTFNQREKEQVVIPRVNNERGNPVLISEQVRQSVIADKRNPGCRRYIDNHPEVLLWLDTPQRAYVTDLDTPDDVENFMQVDAQYLNIKKVVNNND